MLKFAEENCQLIEPLESLIDTNEYIKYTLHKMQLYFYRKQLKMEDKYNSKCEMDEFLEMQKKNDEKIDLVMNGSNMEFLASSEIKEALHDFKIRIHHSGIFFEYAEDMHLTVYERETSTSKTMLIFSVFRGER